MDFLLESWYQQWFASVIILIKLLFTSVTLIYFKCCSVSLDHSLNCADLRELPSSPTFSRLRAAPLLQEGNPEQTEYCTGFTRVSLWNHYGAQSNFLSSLLHNGDFTQSQVRPSVLTVLLLQPCTKLHPVMASPVPLLCTMLSVC